MRLTTPPAEIGRRPPPRRLAAALVAVGLLAVFEIDRVTGASPFQHLYYLPILIAGMAFETIGGVLAALMAIVLYHAANPRVLTMRYEEQDIVQMALFLAVGLITAKLTRDGRQLRQLAATDDLTGLHNLRSFEAALLDLVRSARARGTPISLLALDVDRLKRLNDEYGHITGAEAVRAVGHIVAAAVPSAAVACRFGGDEFVVALPDCSLTAARQVADGLRDSVARAAPVLAGRAYAAGVLSISVGVACDSFSSGTGPPWTSRNDADAGRELFAAADAALYRAKTGGRNRVAWTAPSVIGPEPPSSRVM